MELNIKNIKSCINSQSSYKIFNLNYTQKEMECIKDFNIEQFGNYNSYNSINNIEQFIKNIGNNT